MCIRDSARGRSASVAAARARVRTRADAAFRVEGKMKILFTLIAGVTRLEALLAVPFPQALRSLWSLMRLLSLDLFSVRAAECALQWDAYDALVALALTPLALLGLVAAGYAAALAYVRAFKGDRRAWRDEVRVLASGAALGLSFLLYPALAAACFAVFPCDGFGHAAGA